VADWVTISSLATAGGTLVLAVATFSSVKSGNRSARVAERALLSGQRPLLITSREADTLERVRFGDGVLLTVPGHGGAVQEVRDRLYMAIALRNGGSGLAVIHVWHVAVGEMIVNVPVPALEDFASSNAICTSRPATPGSGRARSAIAMIRCTRMCARPYGRASG
jgi:hypothetical protein